MQDSIIRAARERAGMSMNDVERKLARLAEERNDIIPISSERLGRIERGDAPPLAEEIYSLSSAYGDPTLCYDFCSKLCALGKNIVPRLASGDNLCEITLSLLGSIREFEELEKRLTILTQDGEIDCLEKKEFYKIMDVLERMSSNVQSMKFWAKNHVKD